MYTETARYYDRIYDFKDYAGEVRVLAALLDGQLHPAGLRLLDVACGTGRHLEHLAERYDVEGLNLSPELLAVARETNPNVRFHCADMQSFELNDRFDVITCLFSSIGYMETESDLHRAIAVMARHLVPRGLLIIEPWFTPEAWRPNTVHGMFIDDAELKLARINTSLVEGRVSILDLHHLIGTPEGTRHVIERHEMLLYTVDEMTAPFEAAGLDVTYDSEGLTGRGLYIGRAAE